MLKRLLHQIIGPGRHLVQQSSESDLRRRSTASLAASVTHLAALAGKNTFLVSFDIIGSRVFILSLTIFRLSSRKYRIY